MISILIFIYTMHFEGVHKISENFDKNVHNGLTEGNIENLKKKANCA